MELKVTTLEGKAAGSVQLSDAIFGLEPKSACWIKFEPDVDRLSRASGRAEAY